MSQQRANTAAARPAANSRASNRAQFFGGQNPLTWGYCTRRRSKRRSPGELVDHVSLQLRYRAIRTRTAPQLQDEHKTTWNVPDAPRC